MKANQHKRIIIKLGTTVLTGGTPQLDRARMIDLVRQCAILHQQGCDVIVVSSAAQACGRARLQFKEYPSGIIGKQLAAAVGQPRLMLVWDQLFDIYNIYTGQILLTRADVKDRQRYLNARDTFRVLLEKRVVPVVNENDAVATEEIRVGDNDNLSAMVATIVGADLLIMLTDQDGLFTANPRSDPNATLIPVVHRIDDDLKLIAGGSGTTLGTGGMVTKLQAADVARRAGVEVVIAAGREPDVILRLVAGEAIGTRFPALDPLDGRRQWILAGPKPAGRLLVDAGAVKALVQNGRSLLPAGVKGVEGEFERGATVSILDLQRREIARGLIDYDSDDLQKIAGCRSDQIAERLGYAYGDEAVHRNDMILLAG